MLQGRPPNNYRLTQWTSMPKQMVGSSVRDAIQASRVRTICTITSSSSAASCRGSTVPTVSTGPNTRPTSGLTYEGYTPTGPFTSSTSSFIRICSEYGPRPWICTSAAWDIKSDLSQNIINIERRSIQYNRTVWDFKI
jgi:hypothetical protein